MNKYFLIPLLSVLILSGCGFPMATKEQSREAKKFAVPKNKSNVYIYQYAMGPWSTVLVNEQMAGYLQDETFMKLELSPGIYDIHILFTDRREWTEFDLKNSHVELKTEAGRNYFLSLEQSYWAVVKHPTYALRDEVKGKEQVAKFDMIALKENAIQTIANSTVQQSKQRQQTAIQPNFASPDKLKAPHPIAGNNGKYMSPFTASGSVATWAQERKADMDNGSDLAAGMGARLVSKSPIRHWISYHSVWAG